MSGKPEDERVELLAAAVKGGVTSALGATAMGWTLTNTTAFFGLITTGVVLAPWTLAAWAAGGAVSGLVLRNLSQELRRQQIRHAARKNETKPESEASAHFVEMERTR